MFTSLTDTFTLSNGIEIPCVGYGTYKTPDGEVCSNGVRCALENGYRHIDTAELYANEKGVGVGIKQSGVDRKDIFVSTKVWNTNQGYNTTLEAFERSLDKLQFDYLDLYLIHWPIAFDFKAEYPKQFLETWCAMEDLYKKGVVRAIGVCNCLKSHLNTLLSNCTIKPMVNQIEYHMGYMQEEAVEFSRENGLLVEAWAPLCKAKVLGQEPLKSVAEKYGKTESQVMVRWCLQHDTLPLPKSVHDDRIIENAQVFDFEISEEDMAILDTVECGRLGSHPDSVTV